MQGVLVREHTDDDNKPLTVFCCDLSGSMEGPADRCSKIAKLRQYVATLKSEIEAQGGRVRIVAFESTARVVRSLDGIEPGGGTALDLGIAESRMLHPARTVIFTDGQPDNAELALREARMTPGVIDAIYIGPDEDRIAKEFVAKLARIGAGACVTRDLRKGDGGLLKELREVLALPAPKE